MKLGSLGHVYAIPDSFSCRHEKLSGILGTPVYTGLKGVTETYPICDGTLSRSRRRGIATLQKARRNHCSHVSTQKTYPDERWFSCRRKSSPVYCAHKAFNNHKEDIDENVKNNTCSARALCTMFGKFH